MPELRIDPLSGLRVLVADAHDELPAMPMPTVEAPSPGDDPFLEGNEHQTAAEVYAVRPDGGPADGPGWRVRVVPDHSSTLAAGGPLQADPLAGGRGEPDLFSAGPAAGAHEVVINSPTPVATLADLGADGLAEAMEVWRLRMHAHAGAAYLHLTVDEGARAGAATAHTHAQLYALPFVPAAVARERERFTAYFERTQGRNLLADVLQEEVRRSDRLVTVGRHAVAICPFASHSPFHVQLIPRAPRARFEDEGDTGAATLLDVLERLRAALGGSPPLNLWIRTAPAGAATFCWRIDVVPLGQPTGLELGTGVQQCALAPERAAQRLREVAL